MGQKVNPISLRLGYIKGWDSNWFGGKNLAHKLIEDETIRKYLSKRLDSRSLVSKLLIERTVKRITLSIHTARPGLVIGKQGAEVDKIKEELKKLTNKDIQINIIEINREDAKKNVVLIAKSIASRIEGRAAYKRVIKAAIDESKRINKGIKVKISGRLAGAEMARSEIFQDGSIPLHTLRADIDYAIVEANTIYGKIGIKVWLFNREIYKKPDLYSGFERRPNDHKKTKKEGQNQGSKRRKRNIETQTRSHKNNDSRS